MIFWSALVLIILSLFCCKSLAQFPSVPCPDKFRYVQYGNKTRGLITIQDVDYGETLVEIELSQPGKLKSDYVGKLRLNFDVNEIYDYISSGSAVTYKVFFPIRNKIPSVIAIRVNDETICSGPDDVPSPKTTITLKHTLTANQLNKSKSIKQRKTTTIATTRRPRTTTTTISPKPNFDQPLTMHLSPRLSSPSEQFSFNGGNPFLNRNMNFQDSFRTEKPPPPIATSKPPESGSARLQYLYSVCGNENSNIPTKQLVVGGGNFAKARFPWIVALYKLEPEGVRFQCGASLISQRTVISAAHCFYFEDVKLKEEDILVSLGRHKLTSWSNKYITNSDVSKIILHPDYRHELEHPDADLAIIWLKESVTFTLYIRPVCLWQGPLDVSYIEGVSGIVVGWGKDEYNHDVSNAPKLATANVATTSTCQASHEHLKQTTSNRTLCAGNRDGSGPCTGDSGSGLMIQSGKRWMIRGTLSFSLVAGKDQCNLDEYVVYTDLAMFNGWIQAHMLL